MSVMNYLYYVFKSCGLQEATNKNSDHKLFKIAESAETLNKPTTKVFSIWNCDDEYHFKHSIRPINNSP